MEFLGEDERPYPQIRGVELEDPVAVYADILLFMKKLYQDAGLVHADLSEFNILYGKHLYVIDMGQAVTPEHPRAQFFLARDISNVNRYFSGFCTVRDENEIFTEITGKKGEHGAG
jgi:RIO kinase 1